MKKLWLKVIIGFATILIVLGGTLLISHFHSKNAVARYKDQLRASGEKLRIDELLPPHVDPENNGAKLFLEAAPYFSIEGSFDTNSLLAMFMVAPGKAMVRWQQPHPLSDRSDQTFTNSWEDFGRELQSRMHGVELMRKAVAFPQIDFGLNYQNYFSFTTTHLLEMRRIASALSALTMFELNRGDTAMAITNLHEGVSLLETWQNEPEANSQNRRYLMFRDFSDSLWEVLQAANLTDAELLMLQRDWESVELVQPMERAVEMNQAWSIAMIQDMRASNNPTLAAGFPPVSSAGSTGILDTLKNFVRITEREASDSYWRMSWSFSDETRMLKAKRAMIEALREVETNRPFKDSLAEFQRKFEAIEPDHPGIEDRLRENVGYELAEIGDIFVSNGENAINQVLNVEIMRRIGITAIALKRYELRHGEMPFDLESLRPDYLSKIPQDPVDERPLRYRRENDGTFLLYSIGPDGKDDGGDPTSETSQTPYYWQWLRGRDWVWPQPATKEEITNYFQNLPK